MSRRRSTRKQIAGKNPKAREPLRQSSSRRRQVLSHTGLSIASVLVFLGACEALVRLFKPDVSIPQAEQHFRFNQSFEFELPHHLRDPKLGWRLVPGTYGPMRINSDGFRGAEFTTDSASNDKRIAHLGDSCTMGFTIPDDRDVYSSQLATLLHAEGVPVETLNFGVDGYSSHQGQLLLDSVIDRFEPAYVTLYFGYNDHHFSNTSDREASFGASPLRVILERSLAYRFLRRRILLLMRREARLLQPQRRVDLTMFEANLRAMVQRAREHGTAPILITTPLRSGIPLIENEVLAEIDARPQWVTQDWWVEKQLAKRGSSLKTAGGTPALQQVLAEGLKRYPEWPYLHFLQARELKRSGDDAAAGRALARARSFDAERQVMQSYNERVRKVARELNVELLDLAEHFDGHSGNLFNDVVHPNKTGHRLIARLLAEMIMAGSRSPVGTGK